MVGRVAVPVTISLSEIGFHPMQLYQRLYFIPSKIHSRDHAERLPIRLRLHRTVVIASDQHPAKMPSTKLGDRGEQLCMFALYDSRHHPWRRFDLLRGFTGHKAIIFSQQEFVTAQRPFDAPAGSLPFAPFGLGRFLSPIPDGIRVGHFRQRHVSCCALRALPRSEATNWWATLKHRTTVAGQR